MSVCCWVLMNLFSGGIFSQSRGAVTGERGGVLAVLREVGDVGPVLFGYSVVTKRCAPIKPACRAVSDWAACAPAASYMAVNLPYCERRVRRRPTISRRLLL